MKDCAGGALITPKNYGTSTNRLGLTGKEFLKIFCHSPDGAAFRHP